MERSSQSIDEETNKKSKKLNKRPTCSCFCSPVASCVKALEEEGQAVFCSGSLSSFRRMSILAISTSGPFGRSWPFLTCTHTHTHAQMGFNREPCGRAVMSSLTGRGRGCGSSRGAACSGFSTWTSSCSRSIWLRALLLPGRAAPSVVFPAV